MTVNAVRVRFLFIDGTTEAPRGVCMAAMAQAPKDEFSLLCKPGRPKQTLQSSPPTCPGHLYPGRPCLPTSPLLPREAASKTGNLASLSASTPSLYSFTWTLGPSLQVRECPMSCPLSWPFLASLLYHLQLHLTTALFIFSHVVQDNTSGQGGPPPRTPSCGLQLHFPWKSPDLLRTKDDCD